MAPLIFRAITRPAFALPLVAALVFGYAWWGNLAFHLARQIERHQPTEMRLGVAAELARDSDFYARLTDAKLDCDKGLFGSTYALVDPDGYIPAVAHLPSCDPAKPAPLEGVFSEPPYGLYGDTVAAGWKITPGHLAYFDTLADSSDPWRRVAIAALGSLLLLGSALSTFVASRSAAHRRRGRIRGVGLWLLSLLPWLAYQAHDEVVFGALPVPALAALAAAISLALILAPGSSAVDTVATRMGLDDD